MKTILLFILDKFADWEAAYLSSAVNMLGNGEFAVKTVSLTQEAVTSIGGFRTIPDFGLDTVPEDYEALILIGGMSWRTPEARGVSALAENCAEKGKLLGGICDASAFLGTLGLLNSVPHTSNDPNDLKQWAGEAYGGEKLYVHKQAVRGGNIITANGTAALEFAREVLLAVNAAPENKINDWYNFHKLGYYCAAMPDMR